LLAEDEVSGGRESQVLNIDAGGGEPHAEELLRAGGRQWLQQDAFEHAENHCVRADANGERDERDGGEERRAAEPSQNLPELTTECPHLHDLRAELRFGVRG